MRARRIARITKLGKPLFLSGQVMGGGAVSKAVRNHVKSGLEVYSLEDPALTLHDNPEKVTGMGGANNRRKTDNNQVEVVLGDLDLQSLEQALAPFEVSLPGIVALAIQDHGYSPRASNGCCVSVSGSSFCTAEGTSATCFSPAFPKA